MKAKVKPRINLDNRTKLEEVIPLSTPFILFVDPCNMCNFRCKFCPTGYPKIIKKTGRTQTVMNINLYKKIINDLKEFDKPLKVLRLYKEGEPLTNRHFAYMIKYAKENNITEYIDTTTNGYLLTPERIKPIIDAGLDRINISVTGISDSHFLEYAGIKLNFEKYVENIKYLYSIKKNCEICIKTTGDFLTDEEKNKFFEIFGDYSDRIFIENIAPCWSEFNVKDYLDVNITKGIYNQPITNTNTCPYIFYSTTINSDGTVSLCFLDWKHKLIIGDVKTQSLKEIWNSSKLFNYQIENLSGKRKCIEICKDCGQLSHCLPDNIDQYTDTITERLVNNRRKI